MYIFIVTELQDGIVTNTSAFTDKTQAVVFVKDQFDFKPGERVDDSWYDACGNGYDISKTYLA